MKKIVSLVIGISLVLTVLATGAAAAETRWVEGYVDVATGDPALAYCDTEARGETAQGLFGWMMPVTGGAAYSFSSESVISTEPLLYRQNGFHIYFYADKPSCARTPMADPSELVGHHAVGPFFSSSVPDGASWAVVTIHNELWAGNEPCTLCVTPCASAYGELCKFTVGRALFWYGESTTEESPPAPEKTVRVSDLALSSEHRGKQTHVVSAAATIVDETGAAVEGAAVGFTITSPEGTVYSGAGETDASGVAGFSAQQLKDGHGTWEACVTSVALDGYTYDSASNTETCDSIEVS